MNIFITGGTGFVGSHLIERLLKDNHQIFALVRNPEKVKIQHANLHLIKGDLDTKIDSEKIKNIDIVIHTAGIVHSYETIVFRRTNYEGTINIIEQFKQIPNLKFIFISSLASRGPFDQLDHDMPVSSYGQSKNDAEAYLMNEAPKDWTKIIIRPPMVIGPRDVAVLDIFKMVKDGVILLPGFKAKKKMYSFVCVHDLVETITKSINLSQTVVLYSAHKQIISFEELIRKIQQKMQKKKIFFLAFPEFLIFGLAHILNLVHKIYPHGLRLTPDKVNELFPDRWVCDASYTESLLEQKFEYDLDKTIEITYQDYKKNNWI